MIRKFCTVIDDKSYVGTEYKSYVGTELMVMTTTMMVRMITTINVDIDITGIHYQRSYLINVYRNRHVRP